MNCPSKTFTIGDVVVERYYNTKQDVFGGKPYVDIMKKPEFSLDFKSLPKSKREEVQRVLDEAPKSL
jgi:hypothetical protein